MLTDTSQLNNVTFLWSIISTVIGVLLAIVSVGLLVKTWLDARNEKRQVKIWMQYANGLNQALNRVVTDNLTGRYSSTNDMANAIWSLSSLSFGLYQSLYEERCITEKEFIEQQRDLRAELDEANKKVRQTQFKASLKATDLQSTITPPGPITPPTPMSPPKPSTFPTGIPNQNTESIPATLHNKKISSSTD